MWVQLQKFQKFGGVAEEFPTLCVTENPQAGSAQNKIKIPQKAATLHIGVEPAMCRTHNSYLKTQKHKTNTIPLYGDNKSTKSDDGVWFYPGRTSYTHIPFFIVVLVLCVMERRISPIVLPFGFSIPMQPIRSAFGLTRALLLSALRRCQNEWSDFYSFCWLSWDFSPHRHFFWYFICAFTYLLLFQFTFATFWRCSSTLSSSYHLFTVPYSYEYFSS